MLERTHITHLSYITTEQNLESIFTIGLLSHNAAAALPHDSVADEEVQKKRAEKICFGRSLHSYVNLYFCGRNAMMFRLRANPEICVVKVDADVLDLPGTCFSSRNAAVGSAIFRRCDGSDFWPLDENEVFATSWYGQPERKEIMQAEVLVPDRVLPRYLRSVCVRDDSQFVRVSALIGSDRVEINNDLFFGATSHGNTL